MIFLGPPGVGKTHLAVALALKACQCGMSIYFTNMEDLIKKLRKDHEARRPGKGRSYYKSSLVVVDEVGPLEIKDSGWGQCLSELIDKRQTMIWTVRPSLVDQVHEKWNLEFIEHNVDEIELPNLLKSIQANLL